MKGVEKHLNKPNHPLLETNTMKRPLLFSGPIDLTNEVC